jgi:putative membrane protein
MEAAEPSPCFPILSLGLGLSTVVNKTQLYLFAVILGLAFTAIQFMIIYILGADVGRFAAIVILMLQLTSSGGSYPIELEPTFFTTIHPLFPMTYAVEGLRNIISIGDQADIIRNAAIIIAYGIGSLMLLYLLKSKNFLQDVSEQSSDLATGEN